MGSMNLAFDTSSTLGQNVYAGRELESASICVAVARSSVAVNALERHQSAAGGNLGRCLVGGCPAAPAPSRDRGNSTRHERGYLRARLIRFECLGRAQETFGEA
jgi:hypothetical protein